ncbi:hypothetical protein [Streptomyces sp. WM6378]|uniref:hypothetical protein n=1 Tax=Streptomyces sp. WM6378 TaxID=1415557 RepID=UPI00131B2B6D|nr:hypothetical protein [Streptomyces sp. WM6378]
MTSTTSERQHSTPTPDMDPAARRTASSITDPDLDALYDQRDALLRLLAVSLIARSGPAATRSPRRASPWSSWEHL